MNRIVPGLFSPPSPRMAAVLKTAGAQPSRQVCLLDAPNRLTPWISGAELGLARAEFDLSLRPVISRGTGEKGRSELDQYASAYDAPARLSVWLLRKRPEESFAQARRLAMWELGTAVMGIEKTLCLSAPWQFACWVPGDCRVEGCWLLDVDLRLALSAN